MLIFVLLCYRWLSINILFLTAYVLNLICWPEGHVGSRVYNWGTVPSEKYLHKICICMHRTYLTDSFCLHCNIQNSKFYMNKQKTNYYKILHQVLTQILQRKCYSLKGNLCKIVPLINFQQKTVIAWPASGLCRQWMIQSLGSSRVSAARQLTCCRMPCRAARRLGWDCRPSRLPWKTVVKVKSILLPLIITNFLWPTVWSSF